MMKSHFSFLIISVFFFWSCGKKVIIKVPAPLPVNFSFAHSDTLLPQERIDTLKLEPVYEQFERMEYDPGKLTINKDRTFLLATSGFIHQTMVGTWFIKDDTLNCYVINDYCFDSYIANSNKNTTWKFIMFNHNLYSAKNLRMKPFLCKKAYDFNVKFSHEN